MKLVGSGRVRSVVADLFKHPLLIVNRSRERTRICEKIPTHNLYLIMGTMAALPRTFIVIGLLRSGLDPAELAKQSDLFK